MGNGHIDHVLVEVESCAGCSGSVDLGHALCDSECRLPLLALPLLQNLRCAQKRAAQGHCRDWGTLSVLPRAALQLARSGVAGHLAAVPHARRLDRHGRSAGTDGLAWNLGGWQEPDDQDSIDAQNGRSDRWQHRCLRIVRALLLLRLPWRRTLQSLLWLGKQSGSGLGADHDCDPHQAPRDSRAEQNRRKVSVGEPTAFAVRGHIVCSRTCQCMFPCHTGLPQTHICEDFCANHA
mmetsp:Transcript_5461/g.8114  ORF Transcript_5461/g.8114 Transcript_5461/m.8114 type:complete len:236 (+) Transcript_5461:126-833(+)